MDYYEQRPPPDRRGPHVYFHVEFGVSWNARQKPRTHEVTYRSRRLRERSPAFPRQVPAPNTNYLAAIHDFEMRQEREQRLLAQNQAFLSQYHPGYTRAREIGADGQELRPSRADSRASHERGRSAPPPLGENPWDVRIVRKPVPRSQNPTEAKAIETALDNWKPLPSDPSQFRLGEDGMPWSAWSWPGGYDTSTYSAEDDEESHSIHTMSAESSRRRSGSDARVTHPEEVSTFSPEPLLRAQSLPQPPTVQVPAPGDEAGRKKELEDLGAAMLTVGNGFENQWWNQGQRATVLNPSEIGIDSHALDNRFSVHSAGWPIAAPQLGVEDPLSTPSLNMISPLSASDYAATMSPPSSTFQPLHRTMSTRSEELFFTTPGQRRRRRDGTEVSPNTP